MVRSAPGQFITRQIQIFDIKNTIGLNQSLHPFIPEKFTFQLQCLTVQAFINDSIDIIQLNLGDQNYSPRVFKLIAQRNPISLNPLDNG